MSAVSRCVIASCPASGRLRGLHERRPSRPGLDDLSDDGEGGGGDGTLDDGPADDSGGDEGGGDEGGGDEGEGTDDGSGDEGWDRATIAAAT